MDVYGGLHSGVGYYPLEYPCYPVEYPYYPVEYPPTTLWSKVG